MKKSTACIDFEEENQKKCLSEHCWAGFELLNYEEAMEWRRNSWAVLGDQMAWGNDDLRMVEQ